jgi:hypothetical protein
VFYPAFVTFASGAAAQLKVLLTGLKIKARIAPGIGIPAEIPTAACNVTCVTLSGDVSA